MSFSPPTLSIGIVFLLILMTCHLLDCQFITNDQVSESVSKFSDNIFPYLYPSLFPQLSRAQILLLLISAPLIITLISRLITYLIERRRVYELIEKIPGPPCHPIPFLGHAGIVLDLDRTKFKYGTYALIYQMLTGVHCMYGKETLLRMWMGCRPFVLIFDASGTETILSSNTLTDKSSEYSWLKPWLGEGLVTSNKNKWKTRRKILTPAFHFKILQDFLPIINEQSGVLISKIYRLISEGKTDDEHFEEKEKSRHLETNVLPLITLCTLDTICETAMGIKVYAQDRESKYVNALHQVSELVVFRLTRPWLWPDFIFYGSSYGKRFKRCLKVMQEFTQTVIKERREDWIKNNGHLLEEESTETNDIRMKSIKTNNTELKIIQTNNSELKSSESFTFGENNNKKRRLAFLDLLLHQHLVNETLTLEDVREEVDTFMFAGHDTTAMAISWTLYMLGLYQDVQEKVREEIDEIFDEVMNESLDEINANNANFGETNENIPGNNGNIPEINENYPEMYEKIRKNGENNPKNGETFIGKKRNFEGPFQHIKVTIEMMKKMKYLDCVLKEVQRIYPTAPFVGRELTEDVVINGYTVPKGTTAGILTFLLHRDPTVFPNPEKFIPERFLPENSLGRHPFAYVPFSAGPRNCIGQKFAQMEQKIVVSSFLRHFKIESLDPRDKLVVVGEMVLRPRNGLRVLVTPRNK